MAMNKKEIGAIAELRTELKAELRDSAGELRRHMGVLVEGVRSDIKVIAEQHGTIIAKLEEHDTRFEAIDGRFDKVDRRLNVIEIDLKGVKAALFDVSHRIDNHEVRICRFESAK
jgi:chromosome segregation ATPase